MLIPLQITFKDIPQSDAVEADIRKRADRLEKYYENIMGCRVAVGVAGKHKNQGRLYTARIDISVPGGQIAISRNNPDHLNEDIYIVLRDAFDAAKRKLEEYARIQRGDVKAHDQPVRGSVAELFEEGYGFIETPMGDRLYFHRDNVVSPRFEQLSVGTEVQFLEEMGSEGMQAKRVTAGKHHYVD
jgi:cold shock CspA family protein/ribosome-associated translation inhibitor RaiA